MEIHVDTNNLGEVQEVVEGYKSCTKEVIEFLRSNCRSNEEALSQLIGKILHLSKDFEKKFRTDSRPIRNLGVLDKVRRKILDKRRQQQRRAMAFHDSNGQDGSNGEIVWRPF